MSTKLRASFQSALTTTINDNTSGDVTPADVRGELDNLSDSSVSRLDDPYFKILGTTGGTSQALTLTSANDYPSAAYDAGMGFIFKMGTTSGASPTLNINGIGALPIYDDQTNQITDAGNLVSGRYYAAIYSAAADGGSTAGIVIILRFGSSVVETGVRTDTATYTIGSPGTYIYDGAGSSDWTLPAGSASIQWSKYYFAAVGSGDIVLDGDGTDPISGSDPFTIYSGTGLKTAVWDGETWIVSN